MEEPTGGNASVEEPTGGNASVEEPTGGMHLWSLTNAQKT